MSDFTELRIRDALEVGVAYRIVAPRVWRSRPGRIGRASEMVGRSRIPSGKPETRYEESPSSATQGSG